MPIELVTNPYGTSATPGGREDADNLPGALVNGDWLPEYASYMARHKVHALYLNSARGWTGRDYKFLSEIPWLRLLDVIALPCEDLTPIEALHALEKLSINCHTKHPINFSALQSLKSCFLNWWAGARSIYRCRNLERLYIDSLKQSDLEGISQLAHLKQLTIGNCNLTSLAPVASLHTLEKLELLNCRSLASLTGLDRLPALKWLTIRGSKKLYNFDALPCLGNLEILDLSDCGTIQSLAPLRNMNGLRVFSFAGSTTTVEDGDLSPLERLPLLSMLMFGPRKHYTHRLIKEWNWVNFSHPDNLLERKSPNPSINTDAAR